MAENCRQEDLHAFKVQRNRAENSMDQGKSFRAATKLLSKKEVPSCPGYTDKSVLVNDIGNFLCAK